MSTLVARTWSPGPASTFLVAMPLYECGPRAVHSNACACHAAAEWAVLDSTTVALRRGRNVLSGDLCGSDPHNAAQPQPTPLLRAHTGDCASETIHVSRAVCEGLATTISGGP